MRYRPCHNLEIKHLLNLPDGCGGQYGFLSSHSTNVFSLATFLSLVIKNKKITIFLISWASIVAYSRIYLGVHYPFDIFAGACLGTIIAIICYYIMALVKNKIIKN